MPVVVVESPAKAKTIGKYLGKDYKVLASFGHVRDLYEKDGSVDTEHDFDMKWQIPNSSRKHIKAISDALETDSKLVLATDPDREGEAISWHIAEVLNSRNRRVRPDEVKRVVFNAITKSSVLNAMEKPREIDTRLVDAYFARRALDYLVGFNLSPVLWRKLPGARSAGRVQSVCVRLITEREAEIEKFQPREYWTVDAELANTGKEVFKARLFVLEEKKLGKFDIANEAAANQAVAAIKARKFSVDSVASKPKPRNPAPPFVTATLQQEASRKLRMGPRATMSAAQKLYEAGYITYMRTDGIDMAKEAISAVRAQIKSMFGEDYRPKSPRIYKNKAKNAQEAHECIRPTDASLTPDRLPVSETAQRRLYDLIWKRTMASQMASARLLQTTAELYSADRNVGLRASGQITIFDGFLRIHAEGSDSDSRTNSQSDSKELAASGHRLAKLSEGEDCKQRRVLPDQHFTQPPPRYTEAMLVKKMVELGIGRPSTYSSIVSTIQSRGYVRNDKGKLKPEDVGRLLTAFLLIYFSKYVEYEFTAGLEEDLDLVSSGSKSRREVLNSFWGDFSNAVTRTKDLPMKDVLEQVTEAMALHYLATEENQSEPRRCPHCGKGELRVKTFQNGNVFFGCSRHPECSYSRSLSTGESSADKQRTLNRELGQDQESGRPVFVRDGRYGPYVQLGSATKKGAKPKRASVPKDMNPDAIELEGALNLLKLPRKIGDHAEDGAPIEAGIGPYGPYVRHNRTYAKLKASNEAFEIGMNRAVELLAQAARKRSTSRSGESKKLGQHPDGGMIEVKVGRYGPYLVCNGKNTSIRPEIDHATIDLNQAIELINAQQRVAKQKTPTGKSARRPARRAKKQAS